MYSQHGDTVLDPFAGLCTTNIAAIINGRNSIGIEIDRALESCILDNIESYTVEKSNRILKERLDRHLEFVRRHMEEGKLLKYENTFLGCKVMTSQETGMQLQELGSIDICRSDEINIHADYTNCFHQQS